MSGLFEHLDMFDEQAATATRQSIAVANKRFNDKFGSFLRQASSKKEFESRLALVDTDINNMVEDVANEYGGEAGKIAAAIKRSLVYTATCDCDGNCEGACKCGGCDSCKCDSKKTAGEVTPADEPCENCGGHGCEGCTGDPEATKTSAEERPERLKAQDEIQLADEHSQVNPWLKKQIQDEDQEDGGNLRNKEAGNDDFGKNVEFPDLTHGHGANPPINSQPVANPVPLAETPGYSAGGHSIDETLENAPSAIGTGKEAGLADVGDWIGEKASDALGAVEEYGRNVRDRTLDAGDWIGEKASDALGAAEEYADKANMALHAPKDKFDEWRGASTHKVEEKGDKFYVTEEGEGEVAGPFDSQEEAYGRANELNDLENLEKEAGLWDRAKGALGIGQQTPQAPSVGPLDDDEFDLDLEYDSSPGALLYKQQQRDQRALDEQRRAEKLQAEEQAKQQQERQRVFEQEQAERDRRQQAEEDYRRWVEEQSTRPWSGGADAPVPGGRPQPSIFPRGSSITPAMTRALELKLAANVDTGDKTEKRESLPKGNEDALGGPSPKIDKKKWIPNATNPDGNLEPIDTEGDNSPVPTRQMDIKEKPDYQKDVFDNLKEHDNNVWERVELPSEDENAGFNTEKNLDQPTKAAETFSDNGTNPVTREALASMDRTASFRAFLDEIGMSADQFKSLESDQKSKLWDIYNNYDMPWYIADEGLDQPLKEEPVEPELEAEPTPEEIGAEPELPIEEEVIEEEPIIDEGPEEIEEIIEREDDGDDRVEVIDEDLEDESDLVDDEDILDDIEEDPFANVENMSDEELEKLIEDYEETPDDYL